MESEVVVAVGWTGRVWRRGASVLFLGLAGVCGGLTTLAQTGSVTAPVVPGSPIVPGVQISPSSGAAAATGAADSPAGRAATIVEAPMWRSKLGDWGTSGVQGTADSAATDEPASKGTLVRKCAKSGSTGSATGNRRSAPSLNFGDAFDPACSDIPGDDRSPQGGDPALAVEFQKFVFEASGKSLPLFGYGLFEGGRYTAAQNLPAPSDYVIGPGDEVQVHMWGSIDADLRLLVDRDGRVVIPKTGPVTVGGVRLSQLESVLRTHIGRIYRNFQLSATLGPLRSMRIFVVGHARRPGSYLVSGASTLVTALFDSGGAAPTGSLRAIQVRREGRLVGTFDMYRFIAIGDRSADLKLLSGDVIVVPPAGGRVALLGAVDRPAIYELKSALETLGDLLAYAGGTPATTNLHKATVERIDPQAPRAQRNLEDRSLDAKGLQSTVRDGDVVTLFKISPQFANAVTLRGNVAAPLRYPYRLGMKVSDLIPDREALIRPEYYQSKNMMVQYMGAASVSGERVALEVRNLLPEVNWDYALIERLDVGSVRSQMIPFNLGKAVVARDSRDNIELQPGDVVTVFGVDDVPVPLDRRTRFVRLGGEVSVPGLYQIAPGETLNQLLARTGGLTANAFAYGTEFLRESTRRQQQENLDLAVRRFEAEAVRAAATALQNTIEGEKTAAVQSQIASQNLLLARLRTLRASGRIALDIDPERPELPDIVLEDGDVVTVPYKPSFVGVFGAVLSERSFIHRASYRVADYLDRAGLTRTADEQAVMIIRADGTTESDLSRMRSVFSFGASLLDRKVYPGDAIFVPDRLDLETAYSKFIRGAKDWTAIFYQFGLGAAGIKTLR